ncbi:hypothetical protein PAXRUDRAFT_22430 [Paxillus rubicundulus Ve08.2h10]|uniref:Uncharacterized protein n=1 Tax=Paxillus rubicundulus Ve08.2h10 TaxID=930991 RepID=A0A0D0C8W6_9AGAM|nr:hypothetical protein PAXRUDRAFT_22430 [Paxillus rubicundulus Ve08.2h10]
MATYCSASILPPISLKTPTPFHPVQPHTISDPSPNLTLPLTSLESHLTKLPSSSPQLTLKKGTCP